MWSLHAPTLGALAVINLGLLLLAISNALVALRFRRIAQNRERRQASLRAKWDPWIVRHMIDEIDAEAIHELVLPRQGLSFLSVLMRFARRSAGEESKRIRGLAQPYLAAVQARTRHRSPWVRARAVQTLGELGSPDHAVSIVAALDDSSPLVAMIAAQALCRPRASHFVPQVVARLDRFPFWDPTFLASMLANAGPQIGSALQGALSDPTRPTRVRVSAAKALRQLNDFESAEATIHLIESGADREVLASALRLIAKVGGSPHTPLVAPHLTSADFVIRMAATDALAELGGPNELQALRRVVTDDPSQWVALHAARGLLRAGWQHELRELAATDSVRSAVAAQALAEGGVG